MERSSERFDRSGQGKGKPLPKEQGEHQPMTVPGPFLEGGERAPIERSGSPWDTGYSCGTAPALHRLPSIRRGYSVVTLGGIVNRVLQRRWSGVKRSTTTRASLVRCGLVATIPYPRGEGVVDCRVQRRRSPQDPFWDVAVDHAVSSNHEFSIGTERSFWKSPSTLRDLLQLCRSGSDATDHDGGVSRRGFSDIVVNSPELLKGRSGPDYPRSHSSHCRSTSS